MSALQSLQMLLLSLMKLLRTVLVRTVWRNEGRLHLFGDLLPPRFPSGERTDGGCSNVEDHPKDAADLTDAELTRTMKQLTSRLTNLTL